jgi:SAM-dependent methyltransferase
MSDVPEGPWLNIGCGSDHATGWVNIDASWQAWLARRPALARLAGFLTARQVGHWPRDVVYRDVRRGLGYSPATVAVVFSSHFIEHLHRDEALGFLREAHRVLKPEGVCRVVVPDVAAIVQWYLAHRMEPRGLDEKPSSDVLMEMLSVRPDARPRGHGPLGWYRRWTDFDSHKWMYDAEGLTYLFRQAGFTDPGSRAYLDSVIPTSALAAVEHADRVQDGAGTCVEARR